MKTDTLDLTIVKGHSVKGSCLPTCNAVQKLEPAPVKNGVKPACSYVNIELCGCGPQEGVVGSQGTLLLENPKGSMISNMQQLMEQVYIKYKIL